MDQFNPKKISQPISRSSFNLGVFAGYFFTLFLFLFLAINSSANIKEAVDPPNFGFCVPPILDQFCEATGLEKMRSQYGQEENVCKVIKSDHRDAEQKMCPSSNLVSSR